MNSDGLIMQRLPAAKTPASGVKVRLTGKFHGLMTPTESSYGHGKRPSQEPSEAGEEPEGVAVRECQEETGLATDRVELLCRYLTSPGACSETVHLFAGRVDASAAGERETESERERQIV